MEDIFQPAMSTGISMEKTGKLAMFPGAQQPDLTSKKVSQNGKGEPGSRQIIKTLSFGDPPFGGFLKFGYPQIINF